MASREESMSRHPAGSARTGSAVAELQGRSPYRAFFDALDDLELTIEVYGTASTEADMARAEVRRCRTEATGAWRTQSVTAA